MSLKSDQPKPMTMDDGFEPKPEPPFKVGDVVHLKSGGQTMTVTTVAQGVSCHWHTPEGLAQADTYPAECLVLYEPHVQAGDAIGADPAHVGWRKQHGLA